MTRRWMSAPLLASLFALTACVTINVYFPTAAAEKAADRIIEDVWGRQPATAPAAPPAAAPGPSSQLQALLVALLDVLVAPAHAQSDADLDIRSPEIEHLKVQMEKRFAQLKPFLDAGKIGLTHDGFLALREVPLAERTLARSLVGNENADRTALYREIAAANRQPQWESGIREVFARRWIAKAPAGWWVQDASGQWQQK